MTACLATSETATIALTEGQPIVSHQTILIDFITHVRGTRCRQEHAIQTPQLSMAPKLYHRMSNYIRGTTGMSTHFIGLSQVAGLMKRTQLTCTNTRRGGADPNAEYLHCCHTFGTEHLVSFFLLCSLPLFLVIQLHASHTWYFA